MDETGTDVVVELDVGYVPEAAVSGPLLIQDDRQAVLTFNAMRVLDGGRHEPAGTAIVELEGCSLTKFGYPNDEARPGHPLYAKGLGGYGVYEVLGSSWLRALDAQNRVAFPASGRSQSRHFIFTFHDSTLECLADAITVTVSRAPYHEILGRIAEQFADQ
jgi:hypothetical protein